MSTIQHLRAFINERLSAAAEEIFTEFEKTIVDYEEVIDRQRRLLDMTWKPEINLHTDLPQHHVSMEEVLTEQQLYNQRRRSSAQQKEPCGSQEGEQLVLGDKTESFMVTADLPHHVHEEEEVLAKQQLWNQERSFSLDQEEPEPPQIKEEPEELFLEGEQLGLREESDTFMMAAAYEESDHSEPESDVAQLLSHGSILAEIPNQVTKNVDSGSNRNGNKNHYNDRDIPTSVNQCRSGKRCEPIICDVCGKVFRYKSRLKEHYRIHTGEKLFPCERCGEMFISHGSLTMHIRDHLLEKPYLCKICGKMFAYYGIYMDHVNTHTGEKPHLCNICGKTFGQRRALMKHLKSHKEMKPYQCKTCGKAFRVRNILSKHLLSHKMKKPYRCETCRKIFKSGYNLLRHMKSHTN